MFRNRLPFLQSGVLLLSVVDEFIPHGMLIQYYIMLITVLELSL